MVLRTKERIYNDKKHNVKKANTMLNLLLVAEEDGFIPEQTVIEC